MIGKKPIPQLTDAELALELRLMRSMIALGPSKGTTVSIGVAGMGTVTLDERWAAKARTYLDALNAEQRRRSSGPTPRRGLHARVAGLPELLRRQGGVPLPAQPQGQGVRAARGGREDAAHRGDPAGHAMSVWTHPKLDD